MTPDRWECPDCGAAGWGAVSSTLFRPQFDHDRPDGRRCRAAARRGRSVPAPRRVYSLTQEQARWLQEAWETEGGCYVPLERLNDHSVFPGPSSEPRGDEDADD